MLTGVARKEHVISRLMTVLAAQRRAESATCSRRHAVNLVPLDEFALGGCCVHAVAHVCLCHGAHRHPPALGAGGAPSRAAGGRTRPSRHGVSKPERRGTMRHARMSGVARDCGHPLRRQVRSGRQHLGHCRSSQKWGLAGKFVKPRCLHRRGAKSKENVTLLGRFLNGRALGAQTRSVS